MDKHIVQLANGWSAEFVNRGEFRMACEGWNMSLRGPSDERIRYFENEIVLVNDHDGSEANRCIRLSEDMRHGLLKTDLEFIWVIDFERCMFTPQRVYIHHQKGDKHVSAYEQPAYQEAQEYVTIEGRLIYITFPYCNDIDFPPLWNEYLATRRRQLNSTYFKA